MRISEQWLGILPICFILIRYFIKYICKIGLGGLGGGGGTGKLDSEVRS